MATVHPSQLSTTPTDSPRSKRPSPRSSRCWTYSSLGWRRCRRRSISRLRRTATVWYQSMPNERRRRSDQDRTSVADDRAERSADITDDLVRVAPANITRARAQKLATTLKTGSKLSENFGVSISDDKIRPGHA